MDLSKNSVANRRNRNATKGNKATLKSNVSPAIRRLIQETSNHIPLGRQLQRTPPTSELKITLPFGSETQMIETTPGREPLSPALNMTMDLYTIERAETETYRRSRITSNTICSGSVLEEDPYSLIRGMQGYEVTPADLAFLKRAKQERQINTLQIETTPGREPLSPALNMTMDLYTIERAETETCRRSRITSNTICSGSVLEEDPYSLIRGMQGYEVTPADLAFLKRAKQERQINTLQRELDKLLRQRRNQMLARDLSLASREKILADLDEILSCEQTVHMGRVFLSRRLSSPEVEALDSKSLLAQIKTADVQQAVEEEQAEISELEDRVARGLELREKEEKRQQEIENQNKEIFKKKANIKHLMKELSELKSQLAGAEESLLAIQGKMETLKDTEKEEDAGPQEALQVAPSQAKAPKAKRNGGETIPQQASHVRMKAENTPTTVGESHMACGLRRSKRIATKRSCVESKPVLRKTHPVKASISHGEN
ncbi:uncharacterized protein LOC121548062 [Coregonus clupeaformis]|uniref:uncharacterized protein LOC121548062 n=1 Tax=Coregonus clupeaformis TaxID=59861 RepID=UPI001E1C2690|nr:uncharacterized protein LOC121548062 [Coregonus clupeaformis]